MSERTDSERLEFIAGRAISEQVWKQNVWTIHFWWQDNSKPHDQAIATFRQAIDAAMSAEEDDGTR